MERSAGVILHPSSLPNRVGIGNFGNSAYRFVDFLSNSGFKIWQMCPLGPTSYGDSPYQCFSAFAGNPYFIDWDYFVEKGLIENDAIDPLRALPEERVDYGRLYQVFWPLIDRVYERFRSKASEFRPLHNDFELFIGKHAEWLYDYANFRALKEQYNHQSRADWPEDLSVKNKHKFKYKAFSKSQAHNFKSFISKASEKHAFTQFIFYKQFEALKKYANSKNIQLMGDLPLFVALDSSDVWANPELFELDAQANPINVAGVPPDYFSEDGQLWGNPLFDWKVHKKDNFKWWRRRIKHNLEQYDCLRIDHFRGFESYWSVPADQKNAKKGQWLKAPGEALFKLLKSEFPSLPIIAEDLGIITPEVTQLLKSTGFPGMSVLQFAFADNPHNSYLPHNHQKNQVVYTGTHDNNTSIGWFNDLDAQSKSFVQRYLNISGEFIGWDLFRTAVKSVADISMVPLQDLMSLDCAARLNNPGTAEGNWNWRYQAESLEQLETESQLYLKELLSLNGR